MEIFLLGRAVEKSNLYLRQEKEDFSGSIDADKLV